EKRIQILEEAQIIDIKEAADYLKVSVSTLRNLVRANAIPHNWAVGQIRFFKHELRDWLKTQKKP
ncbi:helix-turn-helix domain-containing protein, partial [Arthrospira platensis SPKY1]|nr:helix-turn-helix domain-containing protein [Arthrospira platensis SPKY1]